jgi:hypothetical protein
VQAALCGISPIGEKATTTPALNHSLSKTYNGHSSAISDLLSFLFTEGTRMLRIRREAKENVSFILSGRIESQDIGELRRLFQLENSSRGISLDLRDVTLVDREGVKFLAICEAGAIRLENCPSYVREWIGRESRPKRRRRQ